MFYNLTTSVFTFKLLFFLHCWTVTHKSLLLKDHDYDEVCPVLKMTYNEGFSPNSQILKTGFPLLYPLCRLIQFSLKLTLFSLLCCRVFAVFNYSFVVYCQKQRTVTKDSTLWGKWCLQLPTYEKSVTKLLQVLVVCWVCYLIYCCDIYRNHQNNFQETSRLRGMGCL